MAQKSKPKTSLKSSYYHFEGMDTRKTHSGKESVSLIDNFRLREDGSLEKRCGYKNLFSTNEKIRGATLRVIDGIEHYYFVSGKTVYLQVSGESAVTLGDMREEGDHIYFFEYLSQLYLGNGSRFYRVGQTLTRADTYIPIYGKDWDGTNPGEQYEEINLLVNVVIITYKLKSIPTGYLSIGNLNFSGLFAVYRNGVKLPGTEYGYDPEFKMIYLTQYAQDDEFIVVIEFNPSEEYNKQFNELLAMRGSSIFYELNNNNLFLWGNPSNNKIYYTYNAPKEHIELGETHSHLGGKVYIPINSFFTVGSEHDRINAMIRHYDRVMLMTNSTTWITDPASLDSKDFKINNINASIGCTIPNGALRVENTLISIGENAVYSWTSDTDELNECNAYSISEPIKDLLPENFFSTCSMTLNRKRREIWFHSIGSNEVWIYNLTHKAWFRFSGFSTDILFGDTKEIGFVSDKNAYLFDPALSSDQTAAGTTEIKSEFASGELEFNTPDRKKLQSLSIRGEMESEELTVTVILDNKTTLTESIKLKSHHTVIPFRFKSSGFYSLILKLSINGSGKHIIHGIELNAK